MSRLAPVNQDHSSPVGSEHHSNSNSNVMAKVEPMNVTTFLDTHFYNESFLSSFTTLKEQLNKEKQVIISLIQKLHEKESIDKLESNSLDAISQLNQLESKRKDLSNELSKQVEKETSVDRLSKYTHLINQLTRIKKYFQTLLIIQMFYSKVKFCIDQSMLSLALKPFINLIELRHNFHTIRIPVMVENEEGRTQSCPHLSKVVDHIVSNLSKHLEKRMKEALNKSMKSINWINFDAKKDLMGVNTNTLDIHDGGSSLNTMMMLIDNDTDSNNNNSSTNTSSSSSSTTTTSTATSNTTPPQTPKKKQQQESIYQEFMKNFTSLVLLQLSTQKYYTPTSTSTPFPSPLVKPNNDSNLHQSSSGISIGGNSSDINNNNNNNNSNTASSPSTATTSNNNNNNNNNNDEGNDRLWAIDIILEPLIKGFKYHFQTARVTNIIEKPEWPIHYIKKVIRQYSPFLIILQRSLERNNIFFVDVHQWFISGLVDTLKYKFRIDIRVFLEKPEIYKGYFYHTMEQIVDFQRFLSEEYSYPNPIEYGNLKNSLNNNNDNNGNIDGSNNNNNNNNNILYNKTPVPFSIFQEKEIFDRWLQLEVNSCDEYFDTLLKSVDRFKPYYRDVFPDIDQLKPTNSSFELINLLRLVTDRYSLLTDTAPQFEFFIKIQMDLLIRYKGELSILIDFPTDHHHFSWTHKQNDHLDEDQLLEYCNIFNSINYIIKILKDWDDELIFIEIYDYMNQKDQDIHYLLSNSSTIKGDENYSAFSAVISDYKDLGKLLIQHLVDSLFNTFSFKIEGYLKRGTFSTSKYNIFGLNRNQHHQNSSVIDNSNKSNTKNTSSSGSNKDDKDNNNSNSEKEQKEKELEDKEKQSNKFNNDEDSQFDVSFEIANALSILRYQLGIIYRYLTPLKLASLWKKLLLRLDSHLFKLLVDYRPKFTFTDGKQFSKDMKTLFLIFHAFSNAPENYMKKIREACILLKMDNHELQLFKEEFNMKSNLDLEEELLASRSLFNLTSNQVQEILKLRINI
ncbi:hypothetical protein CYY_004273 [Polysphondylium violaceum]|uniref:Uncharacterized protein n=1 Tax=Polysphondylium violaceum TaxID=133409 RepID=A0A8J4V5E2_9MYCE|nr:hypothetical protein CYY_004273 [Polysphondylium violaceum]